MLRRLARRWRTGKEVLRRVTSRWRPKKEVLRHLASHWRLGIGGGVRANIFRYPLQKMEVVFLSGEITVVRHLVDANPLKLRPL